MQILFADDDLIIGELFKDLLKYSGHTVTLVTNGQEAVEASANMDLLIVDYHMPLLNGFEVYEQTRPIPCIIISGDVDVLKSLLDLPKLYKLRKPFTLPAFNLLIKEATK